MNTVKSFWIGWAALCVANKRKAGGGAYYFAKKSINADKIARFEAEQTRKRRQESLEQSRIKPASRSKVSDQKNLVHKNSSDVNTSLEEEEGDKSKYEPVRPFRSLKGDRFS